MVKSNVRMNFFSYDNRVFGMFSGKHLEVKDRGGEEERISRLPQATLHIVVRLRPEHPLLTLGEPQIGNRNKTISVLAPDIVGIPHLVPDLERLSIGPLSPLRPGPGPF
jgi:hypothetical protein